MKYSKPQLTKSLRRLREENMIATPKATHGVFVSVLNYDFYQNPKNYESNSEGNAKETRRKQEGNAIKNIREVKKRDSYESLPANFQSSKYRNECIRFVEWWISDLMPASMRASERSRSEWAMVWYHLRVTDGRSTDADKSILKEAIVWARSDDFWCRNFLTPLKLRKKDRERVMYVDRFIEGMKAAKRPVRVNGAAQAVRVPAAVYELAKPLYLEA
jgi:hypothetical protein